MLKKTSYLVLFFFCLHTVIIFPAQADDFSPNHTVFDPNIHYDIISNSQVYSNISGSQLSWQGADLSIMIAGGNVIISGNHLRAIRPLSTAVQTAPTQIYDNSTQTVVTTNPVDSQPIKTGKRNTVKGMIIGAGIGGVLGLAGTLPFALAIDCDDTATDDACLDSGGQAFLVSVGTFGMAAIGAGIGAIFGSLSHKKETVSVTPYLDQNKKQGTIGGAMVRGSF